MALLTLEGVYDSGKITFEEEPTSLKRSRVVVTFLPDEEITGDDEQRHVAAERMIDRMRRGVNFGGQGIKREDMFGEILPCG